MQLKSALSKQQISSFRSRTIIKNREEQQYLTPRPHQTATIPSKNNGNIRTERPSLVVKELISFFSLFTYSIPWLDRCERVG